MIIARTFWQTISLMVRHVVLLSYDRLLYLSLIGSRDFDKH